MAKRPDDEQSDHDKAIDLIVEDQFQDIEDSKVYTNPNQNYSGKVGGQYPDIILVKESTDEAIAIAEVETKKTVSKDEADEQWQDYADLNIIFFLFVPNGYCSSAKDICEEKDIEVHTFYSYELENGDITVEEC